MLRQANRIEKGLAGSIKQFYVALHGYLSAGPGVGGARRQNLSKPSERAVLGQIRVLFLEASGRTFRLRELTSRWPVLHYDAYSGGYASLINRGLIAGSADGQGFGITSAGFKAMGVAPLMAEQTSTSAARVSTPAAARAHTLNGPCGAPKATARCAAFFSKVLKFGR